MHCNMAAVLIIAHAPLASALKSVAAHVYADRGHAVEALDVPPTATPASVHEQARALLMRGAERDWLVLTDVFGATPCNAAQMLAEPAGEAVPALNVRVVSGVNVPMLWRALCYAGEPLDALTARAVLGAGQGVMLLSPTQIQDQSQPTSPIAREQVDHHRQQ